MITALVLMPATSASRGLSGQGTHLPAKRGPAEQKTGRYHDADPDHPDERQHSTEPEIERRRTT